jgi:arylsulfatase A-like enzyme
LLSALVGRMAANLNVLVVVLDGARADHFSCYGYPRETTPFLDTVAREGVRFTTMVASAPWTLPAHASLFTGVHSVTHGATSENRFLPARHRTLPEVLKDAGYRTAAFCTNPWVSPETGFGRGFDAFYTQRYHNRVAARAISYGRRASDKLLRRKDAGARRTNQAVGRWLASGPQPFFAFVHYNETRLPFEPPPPYDRMFLPRGIAVAAARSLNQDCHTYLPGHAEMSSADAAVLRSLYDGALRYVDQRLRELAEMLRVRGDWDRTVVVVTADHGQNLGEHGVIGHKLMLSDTLLRVPLLVRCPQRVPQGFVVDELAQTTDVLPTIRRLLELPEEASDVQGRALLDAGRATPGPAFTVSERFRPNLSAFQRRIPGFDPRPFDVRQKAIRTRREKFIWRSDEANELYDLSVDPSERINLIDREPERADILRRQLFDWLAAVDEFESDRQPPELDESMRQQLQGLGYLD